MRKSQFLKQLERERSFFAHSHPDNGQCFFIKQMEFLVDGLEDTGISEILSCASARLGVTIISTTVFGGDGIKVIFPGSKGFFCPRKFYGRLEDLLVERLNFELPCPLYVRKRTQSVIRRPKRKGHTIDLQNLFIEDVDEL